MFFNYLKSTRGKGTLLIASKQLGRCSGRHIKERELPILTLEIMRFAYLTPKLEFLPICPQVEFLLSI